ncbi:hypothetical protein [uncultured Ruegeria sp.]|uniref:hypothetical protein n=1 Tax=uncultured Ruegeria sp. TaxID=259304 RepID=UPI0026086BD2|nr:hypothetical protein [uncultured Ruegeria sp.]
MDRGEYLALHNSGIRTAEELEAFPDAELEGLVGARQAKEIRLSLQTVNENRLSVYCGRSRQVAAQSGHRRGAKRLVLSFVAVAKCCRRSIKYQMTIVIETNQVKYIFANVDIDGHQGG